MKKLIIILCTLLPILSFGQIVRKVQLYNSSSYALPVYPDSSVVSLKASGILSNATLTAGSSSFGTDQTAAIQAILNTASASKPLYLIWDVAASGDSLKIKSNTYIFALPNCGFILRDNSNIQMVRNYNITAHNNSIVDSNITINGGIWNGNGYRVGQAKQTKQDTLNGTHHLFDFWGVKNLLIKNCSLLNSVFVSITIMVTENVKIDNVIINCDDGSGRLQINQAGIEIDGYQKNIVVSNISINDDDDGITFVPNMIYQDVRFPFVGVNGDQQQMYFNNISFNGHGKGFAFYCSGANSLNNVYISNVSGSVQTNWFGLYGFIGGSYMGSTGTILPSNIFVENVSVEVVNPAYGNIPAVNVGPCNNIVFRNITRTGYPNIYPEFLFTNSNNITIDNYNTINPSPVDTVDQIYLPQYSKITNLNIMNCNIDLGTSTLPVSLLNVGLGSVVSNLSISNCRVNGLKYVVNNAGTITNGRLNGITHTGQGSSDPTINTTSHFTTLWMSNWIGNVSTSGTITTKKGDAFL